MSRDHTCIFDHGTKIRINEIMLKIAYNQFRTNKSKLSKILDKWSTARLLRNLPLLVSLTQKYVNIPQFRD